MSILAAIWRRLGVRWRWYALWLTQPKFLVGVCGVLLDGEGRILLLRHRFRSAYPWGLPSGYARHGERLFEALVREVREETGLTAEIERLVRIHSGYQLRIEVFFLGRVLPGPLQVDGSEVLEAGFFAPDDFPDDLLPSHRWIIAHALPPDDS